MLYLATDWLLTLAHVSVCLPLLMVIMYQITEHHTPSVTVTHTATVRVVLASASWCSLVPLRVLYYQGVWLGWLG